VGETTHPAIGMLSASWARMSTRALFTLLGLFALFAIAGCGGSDEDRTHYTLKVVAHPESGAPSAMCNEMGESSGGTSGDNLTAGAWTETESHTDGVTTFEIRVTGHDGVVHHWHYDESMARMGTTLQVRYADVDGTTSLSIIGVFAQVDPCTP
jgi:hypothetical protein